MSPNPTESLFFFCRILHRFSLFLFAHTLQFKTKLQHLMQPNQQGLVKECSYLKEYGLRSSFACPALVFTSREYHKRSWWTQSAQFGCCFPHTFGFGHSPFVGVRTGSICATGVRREKQLPTLFSLEDVGRAALWPRLVSMFFVFRRWGLTSCPPLPQLPPIPNPSSLTPPSNTGGPEATWNCMTGCGTTGPPSAPASRCFCKRVWLPWPLPHTN